MADKKVMFTVWAELGGDYGPFSAPKTLVYNTPITNVGGAYDNTSGVFTAPDAGFYYFTFFYHAGKERKSGLSLMTNGNLIVTTSDDNSGCDTADHAGNAAFLQLQKGDQVFVRLPANCHVWASGSTTTFSGFLVSQM